MTEPPRPDGWDRGPGCLSYLLVLAFVASFWGGFGVLAWWLTTL